MFDSNPQPIGGLGIWFLFVSCLLLPWMAWKAGRRSKSGPVLPRTAYFANALFTAALLGTLALWVANRDSIELFPAGAPSLATIGLGILAISAGVWEEIVYRGVVTVLLSRWTGSVPVAVCVATVAFALAHLQRGAAGAGGVAPIALVLHGLVLVAGTLYVAMAVHFLYDVAAGFAYMSLAEKLGITRSPIPAPPSGSESRA